MKDEIKEIITRMATYTITYDCCPDGNAEEDLDKLLDCITNLQKSQETLIKNDNEIITNLQEENKKLKHDLEQMYNDTKDTYNEICAEQIDYKSRNEKAIEYIKEHTLYSFDLYDKDDVSSYFEKASPKDLLNILQGENNDRRNME